MVLSYFDVQFWLVVGLMGMALRLTGRKLATFGALNAAALCVVADLQTVLAAGAFTIAAWFVLAMVLQVRALAAKARSEASKVLVVAGAADLNAGSVAASNFSEGGLNEGNLEWKAATLAKLAQLAAVLALIFPVALFLFYKLNLEYKSFAFWLHSRHELAALDLLAQGLRWMVFSYVVLRYVEAAHSVLWKGARLIEPLSLLGYLVPFHMLVCGPVNRYDEHLGWAKAAKPEADGSWLLGLNEVTTGMFYKFVVAEYWKQFLFGDTLVSTSWWDTALIFVYLFFDFAGYARIAQGIGRWLGVPTPVNFRAPFLATSVTDFFTRWHMSLGSFVLRNIFTPLQLTLTRRWGITTARRAGMITLLVGWLFVGLWHRLSFGFLAYGVGMGILVWAEKRLRDYLLKKPWARSHGAGWATQVLGPVYVFVALTTAIHFVIGEIL